MNTRWPGVENSPINLSPPPPSHGNNMRSQRGFSLVEIIVTMALVAIISTLGVPSFQPVIHNSRLVAEANRLVSHIQLARSEAVKRNHVVSLCRSDDGVDCGTATARQYEHGWLVYVDQAGRDSNYVVGDGDVLLKVADAAASDISIRSNSTGNGWLSFKSNGMLDERGRSANYVLCANGESTAVVPGRVVTISVTGQPSISRIAAGESCRT